MFGDRLEDRVASAMEPAFLFNGFDCRALDSQTLQAVATALCDSAGRPRKGQAELVASITAHLTARREAAFRYEHAAVEVRLARQAAAQRQLAAEQKAAADAISEVRRRFAAATR
jgi:hypothetical protein